MSTSSIFSTAWCFRKLFSDARDLIPQRHLGPNSTDTQRGQIIQVIDFNLFKWCSGAEPSHLREDFQSPTYKLHQFFLRVSQHGNLECPL